jgi:hypothetical protein
VGSELADTRDELNALARGVHPPILTDRGSLARRAALPVQVTATPSEPPPPEIIESAASYVAVEGLVTSVRAELPCA